MTQIYAELTVAHFWEAIKPAVITMLQEAARQQRERDAKFVYELDLPSDVKNPISQLLRESDPC